ncbi:hypothetical protein AWU67_04135 [Microterricola viridarii]|uniref:DUF2809 domain-containing protein n=2 Tax=Microterricola viridarii TaxID=412690 RepID=A0A0Y0MQX5_9MICO|nr:hypothetical protein AWU67_04135 [Microterricola viridarii]
MLGLSALATIAVGLMARFALGGIVGDILGGVLYAVLVFLLVTAATWLLRPRGRVSWWGIALLSAALCWAVELLQLTSLPGEWAAVFPPARLVFGTTFSAVDLGAYAIGAVLAGAVAMLASRREDLPLTG